MFTKSWGGWREGQERGKGSGEKSNLAGWGTGRRYHGYMRRVKEENGIERKTVRDFWVSVFHN